MEPTLPASRRWEYADTNPADWELAGGVCTFDAEFTTHSYWAANPGAHFGIALRCDLATIAVQPRFHGVIMGNMSTIQEGAPHAPTMQIESRATGLDPGGALRFLLPNSSPPAARLLEDEVRYKLLVTSKVAVNDQLYIGYKLWRENLAHSEGVHAAWDLVVDTGDMLDPNLWLDHTKSGLVFFSVFEEDLVPWTIEFHRADVTWSNVETVNPDLSAQPLRADVVKVAVLGDSMASPNTMLDPSWPDLLGAHLNASGVKVEMHNLARGGWTYNKANTLDTFGAHTMLDQAISLDPDVVVVALGANDAILNVEGRTPVQTLADATALFAALRTALPNAVIIYASELMYDSANFAPAALKNKGVMPYLFQLKAAGILTGFNSSEVLDDAVAAATKTNFANWVTLDAAIKLLADVDANYTVPYWKAARLGLTGVDGMHLKALGQMFLASAAVNAFYNLPELGLLFARMQLQDYWPWNDPDLVFSALLTDSGDGYVAAAYDVQVHQMAKNAGLLSRVNPEVWYVPSKGSGKVFPVSATADNYSISYWQITNARPMTPVQVSLNGAAFTAADPNVATDAYGNAMFPIIDGQFPVGVHTLRYLVGSEVFGPFAFTVTASTEPYYLGRVNGTVVASGGYVNVPFGTMDANGFTIAVAGQPTVQRAGRYNIQATVALASVDPGCAMVLRVLKNGNAWFDGQISYNAAGGGSVLSANVGGSARLAAGDVIAVQVLLFSGAGTTVTAGAAGASTYLSASWEGF
jgi:lysophospholipase L1-like esterase